MALIVVGIDGSEHSKKALRWALDEARLRSASLRVVYAWTMPVFFGYGVAQAATLDPQSLRAAAKENLDTALDAVAGGVEGVSIERKAVEGLAAQVLVDEAKDADLLVVGSRGHGGFTGLLLGSVSQQCAHHAPCAVVIVREA